MCTVKIVADDFLDPARRRGVGAHAGAPYSFLTPIIGNVIGIQVDPGPDFDRNVVKGRRGSLRPSSSWPTGSRHPGRDAQEGSGETVKENDTETISVDVRQGSATGPRFGA